MFFQTYREEDNRDSKGDGGQHGQTDNQQEHIKLVHFGVGMQQLISHVLYRQRQQMSST